MDTSANANTTALQAGDTVVFSDPADDERGRCGEVTRVLRSRRVGSLRLTVTVFVTCSNGDEFNGVERNFSKVTRFAA
tara:strand:+ start:581 stop:814 length:234 start_codon:yes stop_codon:yes gene_type:complete